jgi:hypothetical protein
MVYKIKSWLKEVAIYLSCHYCVHDSNSLKTLLTLLVYLFQIDHLKEVVQFCLESQHKDNREWPDRTTIRFIGLLDAYLQQCSPFYHYLALA